MNKIKNASQKIILIIFGIFLTVALLEAGLRVGGFAFLSLQEYRNRIPIKQEGAYRIICLGESTTALGGKNSYPRQLEEILNQRDIGIKFSVINKGRPGISIVAIALKLEDNLNKYNPDMVIAMMGINDEQGSFVYKDTLAKKTELFFKSFRTYKLARLLRLHIINKAQELRIHKQREKKEKIALKRNDLTQRTNFKEESILKKAIKLDPENFELYVKLVSLYRSRGKYLKAEEILKEAMEIDPKNYELYVELGFLYRDRGEYVKAAEMFKKAMEIDPKNYELYVELGFLYRDRGEYVKAAEILKKAMETDPKNYEPYFELGLLYRDRGEYVKAAEMLKEAMEIDPKVNELYLELGLLYRDRGEYVKAEEILKETIEINPQNNSLYSILALLYEEQGKIKLAEECTRKALKLRLKYRPIIERNYQRVKEILVQRGIKLVCVQYPVRRIEPLKKMFKNREGIIFVDNERVFKKALKQASYDDYFKDRFGGKFGHCTREGNRLLAENIANVIIKEFLIKNK